MSYIAIEKHMLTAQDEYTRAVISERDELRESSMWQNVCINKHLDAIAELLTERDELKALMHKALDERDHFIGERDRLREVARPVLTALESYTTESGGFCVCCGGESICRKDCEINNAIEALRKELDK